MMQQSFQYILKILVIISIFCSPAAAGDEIRVTVGEWPPFISQEYPRYGIICDIITETFSMSDITVKYGFFPWKRSYLLVKEGDWHASGIWGKTEDKLKNCYFSDVVYTGEIVLFYHVDAPVVWNGNLEDLQGLTLGIASGSAKSKIPEAAEKKGLLKYLPDIRGDKSVTYRMLLAKRIDAVDDNKAVGLHAIHSTFKPEESSRIGHTRPLELWNYHVIFSNKIEENKKFLEIFNKNLEKLKKNGKYDKMWKAFYNGEYSSAP